MDFTDSVVVCVVVVLCGDYMGHCLVCSMEFH